MATSETPGKKRGRKKKLEADPRSRGLTARQAGSTSPPSRVVEFEAAISADGGSVVGVYRDPVGGHWHALAALPIERVQPTPFQRDLSEAHVARLAEVIDKLERFIDPIIAVRREDGIYWTPNGHHRLAAMRRLGARSVVCLVIPDEEIAYQILALNTEKAHNVREKSLEVIRMARSLAELDSRPEKEFALEFEEAAYLTLGLCYEEKGRFSGGAYHPLLRRIDAFLGASLPRALETRKPRAARLLELDAAVIEAVAALKERGFESPYLKAFVIARVNPLRFQRGAKAGFDETIEKMLAKARRFDPRKIEATDLARS
jgi:ParB family chromosome partitioning protein